MCLARDPGRATGTDSPALIEIDGHGASLLQNPRARAETFAATLHGAPPVLVKERFGEVFCLKVL